MYSPALERLLMQAGVKVGDVVVVERAGQTYEGLLMPRPDVGDENCLVIKLKSGYNIGIFSQGASIRKSSISLQDFLSSSASSPRRFLPSFEGLAKPNQRMPVFLLSTGGTISSKVDYITGAVSPQINADEIISSMPRLHSLSPIKCRSLFSAFSEDLLPSHWQEMALGVYEAFKDGACGVVIAHGTDTMGYSAAALSYALENLPGPVVLTGAQRSPDRGSSDAEANLFCSISAAKASWAQVAVCMHADSSDRLNFLHLGTRVRKAHSSARGAFRSIGIPPIGRVDAQSGEVVISSQQIPAADYKRKIKLSASFSSNVHFAWIYPGITPKTVEKWADYDGVLIAGTGMGHAPVWASDPTSRHSILPALSQLSQSGVLLAMASQAFEGRVNMDVYATGRLLQKAGVIGHGCDWLAETAYVKMCWALGQQKDPKKAAELMLTPKSGDILSRTPLSQALPYVQD